MEKVKMTYEGWLLFCPVWAADDHEDGIIAIPKYGMWWLYNLAMDAQQIRNWLISVISQSDEYGGFPFTLRELKEPIYVS